MSEEFCPDALWVSLENLQNGRAVEIQHFLYQSIHKKVLANLFYF